MPLANDYARVEEFTEVAVAGTVVTLTRPPRANGIVLQARAYDLLFTIDGTAPVSENTDAGTGFLLDADAPALTLPANASMAFKFIRKVSANSGVLAYQWIKNP